jgi:divalent anion:Na+ symporter, DASS family
VLFPIVLSVAKGAGSNADDPEGRRLGGYLMFCGMASLALSSALWLTATSCNPIGVQIAQKTAGLEIGFADWLIASSVPTLTAIVLLPLLVAKLFPPGVGSTPEAPAAARLELAGMGAVSRDEWITAVTFLAMVAGWVFGSALSLNATSVAFLGFGVLLMAGVLTMDDISKQGDTLATFLWLAILFALSAQLNELGFMAYVGERLALRLSGLSWPALYVLLVALYVGLHYFFVSQTSQMLALLAVFLDVGIRGGVPPALMAPGLLHVAAAADGVRTDVREQLLLGPHAAGRQPERDLRGERLPDAGRALQARLHHHPRVHDDLPGDRHALVVADLGLKAAFDGPGARRAAQGFRTDGGSGRPAPAGHPRRHDGDARGAGSE